MTWLEPYPDVLLEGLADAAPGPEARYEASEAISVAFVTALQLLPPRQRAVLIMRDVLGLRASEAAGILDSTEESVTSALKRARAALRYRRAQSAGAEPPPPGSVRERELVRRFTQAYEAGDVREVVTLLTEDAWLVMPPVPMQYQGRELAARFWGATAFQPGRSARLVPTRANGQPAFGLYVREPRGTVAGGSGILVLTLAGSQISAVIEAFGPVRVDDRGGDMGQPVDTTLAAELFDDIQFTPVTDDCLGRAAFGPEILDVLLCGGADGRSRRRGSICPSCELVFKHVALFELRFFCLMS